MDFPIFFIPQQTLAFQGASQWITGRYRVFFPAPIAITCTLSAPLVANGVNLIFVLMVEFQTRSPVILLVMDRLAIRAKPLQCGIYLIILTAALALVYATQLPSRSLALPGLAFSLTLPSTLDPAFRAIKSARAAGKSNPTGFTNPIL